MKQKKFKKIKWYHDRGTRNTVILSIFIIVLMGSSVLSMYGSDDDNVNFEKYNGHDFVFDGATWSTFIGNEIVSIRTNPNDLKNVTINKLNLNPFNFVQKIYITFDPDTQLNNAVTELFREIEFPARVHRSCPEDNEFCSELPLITCKDSDDTIGVIYLKYSDNYNAELNDNCLVIEGPNPVKAVNKFILEMKL